MSVTVFPASGDKFSVNVPSCVLLWKIDIKRADVYN